MDMPLVKESMEVACLLLNCLPPHLRTNRVTNLVAKGAGKWSFPATAVCCRGELVFCGQLACPGHRYGGFLGLFHSLIVSLHFCQSPTEKIPTFRAPKHGFPWNVVNSCSLSLWKKEARLTIFIEHSTFTDPKLFITMISLDPLTTL